MMSLFNTYVYTLQNFAFNKINKIKIEFLFLLKRMCVTIMINITFY